MSRELRNIRIDLSYDGANYAGWQIQKNANTVEEEVRKALKANNIDFERLAASGRTDAGVHALNQTVNFLTNSAIPGERFVYVLNSKLPDDIKALSSREVEKSFHARYSAIGKYYCYYVDLNKISNPFGIKYSWKYPYKLDPEKIENASKFLSGKHDYRNFRSSGSSVKTTEREVYLIKPEFKDHYLKLNFIGNGFLYNMVRILTGTIVQYAAGQIDQERLEKVFTEENRKLAGPTAPPQGLFLEKVFYSEKELENAIIQVKSNIN